MQLHNTNLLADALQRGDVPECLSLLSASFCALNLKGHNANHNEIATDKASLLLRQLRSVEDMLGPVCSTPTFTGDGVDAYMTNEQASFTLDYIRNSTAVIQKLLSICLEQSKIASKAEDLITQLYDLNGEDDLDEARDLLDSGDVEIIEARISNNLAKGNAFSNRVSNQISRFLIQSVTPQAHLQNCIPDISQMLHQATNRPKKSCDVTFISSNVKVGDFSRNRKKA